MISKKIKDIYDYTKPPLIHRLNNMCFIGRRNCKIIVNQQQIKLLNINFKELEQRNIELEVKESE